MFYLCTYISYMIRSIIIKLNKLHSSYHFSHLQHFCFFFVVAGIAAKSLSKYFGLKLVTK